MEKREEQQQDNSLEGLHILVAEDNEINAEILRELLRMEDASCELVGDGQAVLERFEQAEPGEFDLIFMDIQMPVMTSSSVMANTLRKFYGSDVLVAPAYSFTDSVLKADYTEKMVSCMIMPNSLEAFQCDVTGAELKDYVKAFVEGVQESLTPFNRASLPTVSGISIEVQEKDGKYILNRVLKDGKEIGDGDRFKVTILNTVDYMNAFLKNGIGIFEKEEVRVKDAWTEYIKNGGSLEEPENYIILE